MEWKGSKSIKKKKILTKKEMKKFFENSIWQRKKVRKINAYEIQTSSGERKEEQRLGKYKIKCEDNKVLSRDGVLKEMWKNYVYKNKNPVRGVRLDDTYFSTDIYIIFQLLSQV